MACKTDSPPAISTRTSSVNAGPGEGLPASQVIQARGLAHDVLARQVVARLAEDLLQQLRGGLSVQEQAVGLVRGRARR